MYFVYSPAILYSRYFVQKIIEIVSIIPIRAKIVNLPEDCKSGRRNEILAVDRVIFI